MESKTSVIRTSTSERRWMSVGVLLGVVALSGCGSSLNQQTAQNAAADSRSTSTPQAAESSTPGQAGRAGDHRSGITGQVVTSRCGGQSAGEMCRERPLRATIKVMRLPGRDHVATVATDDAGRFRVDVAPGSYQLMSRTAGFLMLASDVHVSVRANSLAHVVVTFFPRHPLPVAAGAGGA